LNLNCASTYFIEYISVAAAPEVFDNTKYCVPEYYQYNEMSFYDIDRDMANFRLPQQSKY
jgi:hypothetical protein